MSLPKPTPSSTFLAKHFNKIIDRWQPQPEFILISTALFVGIVTGLGAVVFRYLVDFVIWSSYEWLPTVTPTWGQIYILFMPAIGGLLVGLLIYHFAREAKGHGIPEVMEAVALKGGRIRPLFAVLIKSVASSITIGTGGSAGREGPIVQIGAAIGSAVGQALNLSSNRISNLVACGAAAGIAATFNAPIAGVIFALEVILGRFSVRYFSSVVVAAVAASVIGRAILGDRPAFNIPIEYGVNSLWEYFFYPLLGLLAAVVGVLFTRLLYWSEDLFNRPWLPEWLRPALGGLTLALFAFLYPYLTPASNHITKDTIPHLDNVGYELIEAALANQIIFSTALILLLAKIIATCLTLGSGGSGGVFAPSLFMGAMLGVAFQQLLSRLFPTLLAPAGAYALVGMAAVVAASSHAPITAVIMLFELTGDYQIILPLMLTVVVATIVAQHMLAGESIYTLKLSRRGVRLERGRDADILQSVLVEEVMTSDITTTSINTPLSELAHYFTHSHHHGLIVLDNAGQLWGIVTLTDIENALANNLPLTTRTATIATTWPYLIVTYPDETMGDALARMGSRGLGRLPVVSRQNPYHLLGIIWREGITNAYNLALTRRNAIEKRTHHVQNKYEDEAEFVEIPIGPNDNVIGQTIAQVASNMPKDCVLVSIRRDGILMIPHGDTTFQAGDLITAFVYPKDTQKLFNCLHLPATPTVE
ncbi:MAG TPA: chloride channel protein [Anaerolineae bacterium]|nr:chloride channel protein [Anaerolineae bacterium]